MHARAAEIADVGVRNMRRKRLMASSKQAHIWISVEAALGLAGRSRSCPGEKTCGRCNFVPRPALRFGDNNGNPDLVLT